MPEVSEDLNCPILHVDATSLSQVRLTGVGRCVARIIESLARRQTIALFSMVTRDDLRVMRQIETLHGGLVIHLGPHNVPEPGLDITTWRDRVLALPTQPFDASLAARSGGVYTFRRSRKKRFAREVSVYYDLTALLTPQTHKGQTRRDFYELATSMAPLDDHALAISRCTMRDMVWLCGLPKERVHWAHLGPSQCVHGHASFKPMQRNPNLFLAVSTLEPRKNPENLLRWFLTSPNLPADAQLVWAGPSGWLIDQSKLPKATGNRTVTFPGMVSDARLCELYRQARCLVYVSLYEGFGFPVLDALLHGTPVICSGNSSMLEFAGPGVHLCDPLDIQSIDEAWQTCAAEPAGWSRADLAESCTWDNVARQLTRLAA